ncbi:MAG: 2-amino-thiazoline-4-carboxylic acid hydrolase [Myxococcales bacterium]|nr:MAG: 2-amino-thiazoline-4-carboxylic acid hydrolase [Myxococcales bacterium]
MSDTADTRQTTETDIHVDAQISLLEQAKIQAQVLVPGLHALRTEIGKERADALVGRALADWSRKMALGVGAKLPGTPREKWDTMNEEMIRSVGSDVEFDVLDHGDDRFDFNIHGCRYAEFFKQLGEPELGAVLLCDMDFHAAEVGGDDVRLERTQTIMKGAEYCDFRYRFKSGGDR